MHEEVQVMLPLCLSIMKWSGEPELHLCYFLLLNGNKSFKTTVS
jgi:hypothetical protein